MSAGVYAAAQLARALRSSGAARAAELRAFRESVRHYAEPRLVDRECPACGADRVLDLVGLCPSCHATARAIARRP